MASIPGVPNLLRNAPRAIGITLLGNIATAAWNFLFPGPQWGVFLPGTADPAIAVSSVSELDVSADARASDYPIQTGSFTNYNKVRLPNAVLVRLTRDGLEAGRSEFLDWLDFNATETTLFDIVCPETRWPSMTLVSFRIGRSARAGATMITADCVFQQVRELPVQYSSSNIESPENKPTTPTARVNITLLPPESAGGPVSWP